MKAKFALILMAGLLFVGCKKQAATAGTNASPSADKTSGGNPLTAPIDYLGAIGKAQQTAQKTVASVGMQQAIQMFQAQEGRFPNTLGELVPNYVDRIPPPPAGMKYSYDAKNGTVKVVPQ